jgi:hypothetical protein
VLIKLKILVDGDMADSMSVYLYASAKTVKQNSLDEYTIRSSEKRERWTIVKLAHPKNSATKSRSETAYREFGITPSKPVRKYIN